MPILPNPLYTLSDQLISQLNELRALEQEVSANALFDLSASVNIWIMVSEMGSRTRTHPHS